MATKRREKNTMKNISQILFTPKNGRCQVYCVAILPLYNCDYYQPTATVQPEQALVKGNFFCKL